ncbi:acyltransferase [Algisphaera agarilytica]|uniref:Surface polysaccharide O-acyltransferase-like enzyme n=1 Tax=Algisphaera agarilytica TaxID=1385975 RepID=A0A7X0LMF0_9BACT|nr:acyltransferase [Algisphaera agarilytica]MBB6431566.1 surface polysaccharide O-acyltransferase-like enzyme [Algisphaera agarilytica]
MGRGPQTDCAPSASAKPSPRYPLLDALRIVAMMDIVSIHVTKHYLLWGMGLPVFIIVAVALGVRKPELPGWGELPEAARKRAARVLWPWVVWTVFFGLNRVFWAGLDPEKSVEGLFYPWMILGGTSMHLWFLPFIFVAELAVLGLLAPLRRVPTGVIIAVSIALATGCIVLTGAMYDQATTVYGGMTMGSDDYAERAALYGWTVRKSWLFGTASVFLGIALGRTLSLSVTPEGRSNPAPRQWLLAGALAMFGLYYVWKCFDNPIIHGHAIWQWWRQAFAFLAVALAVQVTGKTPAWLMRIAILTMGIYLLHGWVGSRFGQLLGALYETAAWKVLFPVGIVMHNRFGKLAVIWLLTALLVMLLRRTKAKQVL